MAEKPAPRERAAAPKSRGEKQRAPPGPGPPPAGERAALLGCGRGDRDAGDILAELLARVMDECAHANAARQSVPFAVGRARDALLQIARCRFPPRDEGDTDPREGDDAWWEDEEPPPHAADPWARGSVPVLPTHPAPGPAEVPGASTILPTPAPSSPELLPDDVPIAPRLPEGKSPRGRCLLCPAKPPAPCPPPRPAEPPAQRLPRWSPGDVEGSGTAGVRSRGSPLPPRSCTSPVTMRPGRPPRSTAGTREGSGTVPGVRRPGPGSRPKRWIRPRVEVLDVGAEAKPPARRRGARRHSRAPELRRSRVVSVGGTRLQPPPPGSPQPPSPLPRQLGTLLDAARLAPGVTVRRGGGVCIPAHGEEEEEEEEEEEKRDLRPIRPAVPSPAIAARQLTGDGER